MAAKKKKVEKVVKKKNPENPEREVTIIDAQLKAAAIDLQKVIEPNPPINLKADRSQLETEIKDVAKMLAEGDEIQADTAAVLKDLAVELPGGIKIVSGKKDEDVKEVAKEPMKKEKALKRKKESRGKDKYGFIIGGARGGSFKALLEGATKEQLKKADGGLGTSLKVFKNQYHADIKTDDKGVMRIKSFISKVDGKVHKV